MQFLRIIALSVAAAIVYGVVHDQITVRVCLEYFTVGHPQIFHTTSPTLLALGWGIVATWWMGLILGLGLAIAARAGSRPKLDATSLLRPIAILLACMGAVALLAGLLAAWLATQGKLALWAPLAFEVPPAAHRGFLADLAAHSASYLVAGVGGLILIFRVWQRRSRSS